VNGTAVAVSTISLLKSQNGDRYYTSGQLQIDNTFLFGILIDADGCDPDSVLTSVASDAITESQFRSWSDQFYIDCLT